MAGALIIAAIALVSAQGERRALPLTLTGAAARPIEEKTWINLAEDYPAGPLRERADGTVAVRLFVNGRGRVSGCLVLQSAGFGGLDMATCRILRSRARFVPFAGRSLATFDYRIYWDLAQATPIGTPEWQPESFVVVEPPPPADARLLLRPLPAVAN